MLKVESGVWPLVWVNMCLIWIEIFEISIFQFITRFFEEFTIYLIFLLDFDVCNDFQFSAVSPHISITLTTGCHTFHVLWANLFISILIYILFFDIEFRI